MVEDFKKAKSDMQIPYDWTIYYLRKKALTEAISKEELAWVLLNFNQNYILYNLNNFNSLRVRLYIK